MAVCGEGGFHYKHLRGLPIPELIQVQNRLSHIAEMRKRESNRVK